MSLYPNSRILISHPIPRLPTPEVVEAPALPFGFFMYSASIQGVDPANEGFRLLDVVKHAEHIRVNLGLTNLVFTSNGGFGTIYRAQDKDQNQYAVKVIRCSYRKSQDLIGWANRCKREIYYLSNLKHENLVRFYGHTWLTTRWWITVKTGFKSGEPNCLLLATELLGTDLIDIVNRGPLSTAGMLFDVGLKKINF